MQPTVDIILLNHNAWRHTVECLESVMRSDYPAFRVILCDNRSTDDSLERIRAWLRGSENHLQPQQVRAPMQGFVTPPVPKPISFVESDAGAPVDTGGASVVILRGERNTGFAGGNNAALKLFLREDRAAYAWILNNDTVVAPDCLARLVTIAESDHHIAAVGATVLEYSAPDVVQTAAGGTVSRTTGAVRNNQMGVKLQALDCGTTDFNFVTCCSLLGRREALEAIGLLDERFFIYAEDGDFSMRMTQAGWRLAYAPDALIWHKGSVTTVRGSPFNDYHLVRSCLLFVHKWQRKRMPLAVAYWLYRGLGPKVVRRQWTRARAVCRAFFDVVREISPA